jgi:hypothetical protein
MMDGSRAMLQADFAPGDRDRKSLACGCLELDDVAAVALRAVDHDHRVTRNGYRCGGMKATSKS